MFVSFIILVFSHALKAVTRPPANMSALQAARIPRSFTQLLPLVYTFW